MSFRGDDNQPTSEEATTIPEVILCSPYKPEKEAHLKELKNEEEINKLCNEAFDELLTQEFNPNQEDFEDDAHQDDESKDADDQGVLILSGLLTFVPWKSLHGSTFLIILISLLSLLFQFCFFVACFDCECVLIFFFDLQQGMVQFQSR